jgi:hypothetical protein
MAMRPGPSKEKFRLNCHNREVLESMSNLLAINCLGDSQGKDEGQGESAKFTRKVGNGFGQSGR